MTSTTRNTPRAAWARRAGLAVLAASLAWPLPAAAFETLLSLVRSLPAGAPEDGQFDFAAPSLQAGWPAMAMQGIGVNEMNRPLIDRELGLDTVGIAFPDLDGMLHTGRPPDSVIHLSGPGIAVADMRPVLLARPGMAETEMPPFAVFSAGADYTIDAAAFDGTYPFGAGYRAHRVAVRDGLAIVAFADAPLFAALEAVAAPPDGGVAGGLVEAAASVLPEGLAAYGASGLPAAAFRSPSDAPAEYALVVASTGAAGEAAQFLLAFPDDATAAAGAEALAAALEGLWAWPEGAEVTLDTVATADGTAAVVTAFFQPGSAGHPASTLLNSWRSYLFAGGMTLPRAP